MKERTLDDILTVCLDLDKMTRAVYERFALEKLSPALTEFWKDVVKDETMHIRFWESALRLNRQGDLFTIDNLPRKYQRLLAMRRTLARLQRSFREYGSPEKELLHAYRIEMYLFDPAFISTLQTVSSISGKISSQYENHTMKFIHAMRLFGDKESRTTVDVLGEILKNLYEVNQRLFKESVTDPLTGLLNRRGFFNTALPFLALAERNRYLCAVLMIDLDNFKQVNDKYGHPMGDRVLKSVSALLKSSIRRSDIPGRYGGEEFILLCHAVKKNELEKLCERIRKNVEMKSGSRTNVPVTISIGGVISKIGENGLQKMVDIADENLLAAKAAGKNCCKVRST